MQDYTTHPSLKDRPMSVGFVVTDSDEVKEVQGFYPHDRDKRTNEIHPNGRLGAEGQRALYVPEYGFSTSESHFFLDRASANLELRARLERQQAHLNERLAALDSEEV